MMEQLLALNIRKDLILEADSVSAKDLLFVSCCMWKNIILNIFYFLDEYFRFV